MGVERNGREWLVFRNSPRDHDDREKCKNFGKRQNKLHTQRDRRRSTSASTVYGDAINGWVGYSGWGGEKRI